MNILGRTGLMALGAVWVIALAGFAGRTFGQQAVVVEDFEFASSDEDAAAGVIDLTDFANTPAFYINGECIIPPSPCEEVAVGLFSIGTDAAFCQQFCEAGSRIGFRRHLDPKLFPHACPVSGNFLPLNHSYGDPANPGPVPPDFPLSDLQVLCAAYGDGSFTDGPTGTHFWINFVDCEGEVFEYINFSETSLYSELWTFDVEMGRDIIRLSADSIVDGQPIGDGLLTEISAIECFIQDADDPPTSFGKWYVDDLRIVEPAAASIPTVSAWGLAAMVGLLLVVATLIMRRRYCY